MVLSYDRLKPSTNLQAFIPLPSFWLRARNRDVKEEKLIRVGLVPESLELYIGSFGTVMCWVSSFKAILRIYKTIICDSHSFPGDESSSGLWIYVCYVFASSLLGQALTPRTVFQAIPSFIVCLSALKLTLPRHLHLFATLRLVVIAGPAIQQ